MKNFKDIILEKLILNKSVKSIYNPDHLNNNKSVLYSDRWDFDEDEDRDVSWESCQMDLNRIDDFVYKQHGGFMSFKYNSLSKSKDIENDIQDVDNDLDNFIDKIITGKDYGYEVRVQNGHIEIDCINSGSHATYYIYALDSSAWDHLDAYWNRGDEDIKSLSFLYAKGSILEIKI